MTNDLVAQIFRGIAELLEIKGDNPFRIRAYLRAADSVESLQKDVSGLIAQGALKEIPGIGEDLASKIKEIVETGRCRHYEELKKAVPEGVVQMLEIPSVGPKTARLFYEKLKVRSLADLKKAARGGRLLALEGIKQKTADNILKGLELLRRGKERLDLLTATAVCGKVIDGLKKTKYVQRIAVAGSLRRMKETVRDIDILVVSKKPREAMRAFVSLPEVKRVLARGETKSSVLTLEDVQVDLRVLKEGSFGAGLLYFTGSKNHNIKLRHLAVNKSLKINEYGLFDKRDRCLASGTEEEMYKALGMDYIEPEMREDLGEIEAALARCLPRLLELKDIRGDFHAHTSYSDGKHSVEQMARGAQALDYEYICLTDHSKSLRVAHGLDKARLKAKRGEIDRVNKRLKGFKVLFGTEVEIDSDGKIDYEDEVLAQFDVTVAAIHSGFKQSKNQLTRRIVKACRNRHVHIIAHPSGRLWPARGPYEIDYDEIFKACCDTNTALEINAHPSRLDLTDVHARGAKEKGVRLAIGTDAHDREHLSYMRFGVGLARRAWLEKKDVLNAFSLAALLKAIKK